MEIAFNSRRIETRAATVLELLKEMGINPETVVVSVNGEIVPETEKIRKGDRIETIRVVSGG